MHVPDLSTPRTDPPMTAWWVWVALAILTLGAILAVVVLSRQGGHIAANEQTAAEVQGIASEVKSVRSEVHYLHDFVRRVEADAEAKSRANAARIDRVERRHGLP